VSECVAKARYYLANPGERTRIRRAGEAHVRAHHTFDQRIEYILTGREWTPS
jgi:spore maturation protein CgeB